MDHNVQVGGIATVAAGAVSFCLSAIPVLQFIAALISIIVGVITLYKWTRLWLSSKT